MISTWGAVSQLDRMVDDVMGSMLGTAVNTRSFTPAIDIRTGNDALVFACDVPGVKAEDLDITLENQVLTIKGVRKFDSGQQGQLLLGRSYGEFSRSFALPDYVDAEKLSANLADGVLTVTIPKQPKAKPRKIQIGGGAPEAKQIAG